MIEIFPDDVNTGIDFENLSFKDLFNSKYKIILLIIINRTKKINGLFGFLLTKIFFPQISFWKIYLMILL
jgi:hypothetical protein